jgi:hypothetical protein
VLNPATAVAEPVSEVNVEFGLEDVSNHKPCISLYFYGDMSSGLSAIYWAV